MSKSIPKFIGAKVRRREDPALITGKGSYVADICLPEVVTMALVRSPYAHAKVKGVDISKAISISGVVGIYTASDINSSLEKPLPVVWDVVSGTFKKKYEQQRFPLAEGRVRHVGDPVAVVVAESAYIAADAVDAVDVSYEPLDVVTDPFTAMESSTEKLHDDCHDNIGFLWSLDNGDVDSAFDRSAVSVELRTHVQRVIPNAMEPRATAAKYEEETGFTVWSSTQFPHQLRGFIAGILGVAKKRVRVIAPEVGGGFGAKCNVYGEEVLAPWVARKTGRPVRWIATRSEDYISTSHGRDQHGTVRLAADLNGRISAVDLDLMMDCGAYFTRVTPIIPPYTGMMMSGVYDIRNVRVQAKGVFTNKVWNEPYRGAGRPEAMYFLERAVDVLAKKLNMDPTELRRRNFIPPDKFPYRTKTGLTYDSGNYKVALDKVLELVDYAAVRLEQKRRRSLNEKSMPLLGVGVTCYVELCGFGPWEHGTVRVKADGSVRVLSGTSPHGQGHATSWSQIVADVLQMPIEKIEVLFNDTDVVPKGIGTMGSRSAAVGGMAVMQSARVVKEGAQSIAAHLLEAAFEDVRVEDGEFHVVGMRSRAVTWTEVAAFGNQEHLPEHLQGKLQKGSEFKPSGETFPFGAHASVVEIDPDTGEISVLRLVTVDDCGKVLNPLLVEGQVHGGLAQGLGQALWERAVYDESGNLTTGNLMEYPMPKANLLPSYETHRTETATPHNLLGVKGIGEAATIGSTPSVANAVLDALSDYGKINIDMPFTPEKIWRVLQGR